MASTLRGILWLSAGVSLFGVVDGLSKLLVETQSFGQIMLARYALAFPLVLALAGPARWGSLLRTARPGLQTLRAASPFLIGGGMVLGLAEMSLADATVVLFAGPFAVVALSGLLLGERVGVTSWIAVGLGFLAVILVARPGLGTFTPWVVFPLVAAGFYAVFQLLSRHLSAAGEAADTTLAWTLGVGLLTAIPFAAWDWPPMDARAWAIAALLSVTFAGSHLCVVRAYDHAPANVLAPFSYVQIAAAALFGLAAFGDVPDALTLAGIALIAVAAILVVRRAG
jgi:drug/metabolite transporter (DMT)-like permease